MTELKEMAAFLDLCKLKGVHKAKYENLEIEFFEPKLETAPLDTVALAKALQDSMPPDSSMMFAATEDPAPEPELPKAPE